MTPRGITSADLEALGFVRGVDGFVRRVLGAAIPEPRGTFIGIDPSLKNLGLASVELSCTEALTQYVGLPSARRKGEDEAAFLTRRLGLLLEAVRAWVVGARSNSGPVTALVEGAKPLHGKRISRDTLPKLGTAVGVCWAAAALHADEALWVPPDWTWEVLCRRAKGGAGKADRWTAAEAILREAGISWPLPSPAEIDERGPQAHEADALALCAAKLAAGSNAANYHAGA